MSTSSFPALTLIERRVLGVLVEKAKTTPDVYPLSVNAVVTGCNQKSNRDPVLDLNEVEIEDALTGMQPKGLTTRITGGRVERWRHNLYEVWQVNKVELAVLAELLLRGAQTEGELRGRASRMEPIEDLETLRQVLPPLAERGLIVFLGPEGRRGTQITHGFLPPQELEMVKADVRAEEPAAVSQAAAAPAANPDRIASLESGLEEARKEIAALRNEVAQLREQVRGLKEALAE